MWACWGAPAPAGQAGAGAGPEAAQVGRGSDRAERRDVEPHEEQREGRRAGGSRVRLIFVETRAFPRGHPPFVLSAGDRREIVFIQKVFLFVADALTNSMH